MPAGTVSEMPSTATWSSNRTVASSIDDARRGMPAARLGSVAAVVRTGGRSALGLLDGIGARRSVRPASVRAGHLRATAWSVAAIAAASQPATRLRTSARPLATGRAASGAAAPLRR